MKIEIPDKLFFLFAIVLLGIIVFNPSSIVYVLPLIGWVVLVFYNNWRKTRN